jgi:TolA-binding protein
MNEECTRFEELLLDLVYDEIEPQVQKELLSHAAQCERCSQALAEIETTRRVAQQLPALEPLEPDRELDQAILSAARSAASRYAEATPAPDSTPRRWEAGPTAVEKGPGLLERMRLLLLRPALVTACVALLVLVLTVFLKQSAPPESEGVWPEAPGAPFLGPAKLLDRPERTGEQERRIGDPGPLPTGAPAEEIVVTAPVGTGADEKVARAPQGRKASRSRAQPDLSAPGRESLDDLLGGAGGPASSSAQQKPAFAAPPPAQPAASKKAKTAPARGWEEGESAEVAAGLGTAYGDLDKAPSPGPAKSAPSPSPTLNRALAAYRRGDCGEASAILVQLLASPGGGGADRPSALHHLGRCEKRRGHCGKALIWYDELLAGYPSYPDHHRAVWEAAKCHRRLGHIERAQALLEELSQISGWSAKARGELEQLAAEPADQQASEANSP